MMQMRGKPLESCDDELRRTRRATPDAEYDLVIRNGRAVWNASHFDITSDVVEQAVMVEIDVAVGGARDGGVGHFLQVFDTQLPKVGR